MHVYVITKIFNLKRNVRFGNRFKIRGLFFRFSISDGTWIASPTGRRMTDRIFIGLSNFVQKRAVLYLEITAYSDRETKQRWSKIAHSWAPVIVWPWLVEQKKIVLLTWLLTYLLTPCNIFLLGKLTGSQLIKKSPAFYGTEGSLQHLQKPATCP
jgi:hypothetical protein